MRAALENNIKNNYQKSWSRKIFAVLTPHNLWKYTINLELFRCLNLFLEITSMFASALVMVILTQIWILLNIEAFFALYSL